MVSASSWWQPWVLSAIAGVCLWVGFRNWRLARSVADTARSRVRSAAQGYVELYGVAESPNDSGQRAPLSGLRCVWWSYRIEERSSTGKRDSWVTVESASSDQPILLRDESGACLIYPREAQVIPGNTDTWSGSPPALGSAGLLSGAFSNRRYIEQRIAESVALCVMGEFSTVGGARGDIAADVSELLHTWKSDQAELLRRFDADHDGVLSDAEWEAARAAAQAQVLAQQTQQPVANVITKPSDGRPYLVAAQDPQHLARRFRWRAIGCLAACLFLVIIVTRLLLERS